MPITGVPVYFTLIASPGKSGSLVKSMGVTDDEGAVEIELQTAPSSIGVYRVGVEVADTAGRRTTRSIVLEADAMHIASLVVGVLGGLAIFVFGITLMSEGLQQVAGNRLRRVLAYITGNHVRAVCAGTMVAGLIQSSSSTTVMTVGFVNAGLLTLKQAIGVIFGANIGTTASGQIVSFNIGNIALPAITLGVVLLLTLRRPPGQGLARTILGFGSFLWYGLMSSQWKAVSTFPVCPDIQALDLAALAYIGADLPMERMIAAIGIGVLIQHRTEQCATIGLAFALANSGLLNTGRRCDYNG